MKNPLNRRLTRELKGELGKYLVILILLIQPSGLYPVSLWRMAVC